MKTQKSKVNLRDALKALLSTGLVEVNFTKKDGTERIMNCTTMSDRIPEEKQPIGESVRKENTDILRVYDIDSEGWRSFRVDSVNSFDLAGAAL